MIFGTNLTSDIQKILFQKNTFAVTDENVASLYPELFEPARTVVLTPGESNKNIDTVASVCAFLATSGADRHSVLVAVGGGVVGDITGFAASMYMRGIAWQLVPTTLLALCDSSVGGKTGVNLNHIKNMIGAFHFPQEVYLSTHFIKTLPDREFMCGIGEAIKTACLSESVFDFFVKSEAQIYKKCEKTLEKLVRACAQFKDKVVTKDPKETTGLRKILNYGHTAGHAFETADRGKLSHGEYILHGMRVENRMFGDVIDPTFFVESERLIKNALGDSKTEFNVEDSLKAAFSDKKNKDAQISVMAVLKPDTYKEMFFSGEEFKSGLVAAFKQINGNT